MSQSDQLRNHKLYEVWSQVPVIYYQQGTKNNFLQRLWHTHKINFAKRIIENITFQNCLDVGCASGFMVSEIAQSFPQARYFGIDIYDKAIKYARKMYPNINFEVASASKMPFRNNHFDLILFYETIEHVENPVQCLLEIKRILKKDGTLILTMDSGSLLFKIVWFIWENSTGKVWKKAHLHPFHHKELEEIIIKSGFKIKSKTLSFLGMEVTFVLNKN